MDHQKEVQLACDRAIKILGVKNIRFRPMRRKNNHVNTRHGFIIGRTNLKTGLITIDIYTPKKRQPKTLAGILRVLGHEIAHYQKKPFQQLFQGRWISRQHYPEYYRQVRRNINKLKKDKKLKEYF